MNNLEIHSMTMQIERDVRNARLERQLRVQEPDGPRTIPRMADAAGVLLKQAAVRLKGLPRIISSRGSDPATA